MHAEDPSPPNSYSQQVGQMAEEQQQSNEEIPDHPQLRQQNEPTVQDEEVRRGDGTVLKESDKPRNPKKKMWEEDVEREKREQAQAEQQGTAQERQKDEL